MTVLGIGNPFYDRSLRVEEYFLARHQLAKGTTQLVMERKQLDRYWDDARNKNSKSCWSLGKIFELACTKFRKKEDDVFWTLGGSCTNVIKALARFNHPCAILGKIGNDDMGAKIEKRLKDIGITSLLTHGKHNTGIVNCFITPDNDRTMQTYLGAASELSGSDLEPAAFQKVQHVHLEGYLVYYNGVLEKSIELAKQQKVQISLDLASVDAIKHHKEAFDRYVRRVDFIFGNAQEIQVLTGIDSLKEAVESFGPNAIIIATNGKEGCWIKDKGKSEAVKFEALKVSKVIDTTGAGDFFLAGFLHGIQANKGIEECVRQAHLCASFVIQQEGADLPEEKWAELTKLIGR